MVRCERSPQPREWETSGKMRIVSGVHKALVFLFAGSHVGDIRQANSVRPRPSRPAPTVASQVGAAASACAPRVLRRQGAGSVSCRPLIFTLQAVSPSHSCRMGFSGLDLWPPRAQ